MINDIMILYPSWWTRLQNIKNQMNSGPGSKYTFPPSPDNPLRILLFSPSSTRFVGPGYPSPKGLDSVPWTRRRVPGY